MPRRVIFAVFVGLVCAGLCSGQILEVGNGTFATVQGAIDAAAHGDIVRIHPGTYYENIDFLGKAITVTSLDPNDPDIVATTILDGSQPADPNIGSVVTFKSGEGNDSVLTGLTIQNGTGSWLVIAWEFKGPKWNRCGGGVVSYNLSQPTITKNVITNNITGEGGGIYIYGDPVNPNDPSDPPLHITPVITDNRFTNNQAIVDHGYEPPDNVYECNEHGDGGAIVCFQGVDATISRNIVSNNRADSYGGGIHLRQWSHGLLSHNDIQSNDSALGAGIHITYYSDPWIQSNQIRANSATALGGGGIYVYFQSDPLVDRNRIINNSSLSGSAISVNFDSAPIIRNNVISANLLGAPIKCNGSLPILITHNTIVDNIASDSLTTAAGISGLGSANVIVENNIISSNAECHAIYLSPDASGTFRYNNFWNNSNGIFNVPTLPPVWVEANLSENPNFRNTQYDLNSTSPCIAAGDPCFVLLPGETDIAGRPRCMSRTDMGAYEAYPVWNLTQGQEYQTIAHSFLFAASGDEILLLPCTHTGNLFFDGKNLYLHSISPTNWGVVGQTVLQPENPANPVFTFSGSEDSTCSIEGITLSGVTRTNPGGAVLGNGCSATIRWCRVVGNEAPSGAALYDFDGLVANCYIQENITTNDGGALALCDGQIYNTTITGNNSIARAAAFSDCNAEIINCTVANNSAPIAAALENCQGLIANSIIFANTSNDSNSIANCTNLVNCCLQEPEAGPKHIYTDPCFVDPQNNYHLQVYSKCIDSGDPNVTSALPSTDIDHEIRAFDFSLSNGSQIDIGADEVVRNQADFDNNGTIDEVDLWTFAINWLNYAPNPPQVDLLEDGLIQFYDYSLFSNNWRWLAPWHTGIWHSALEFDSTQTGHVMVHTPEGCILNNVFVFTYTAWIYPLQFETGNKRILGKNERALLMSIGGTLAGYTNGAGTARSHSAVQTLQTHQWQFVSMTYDWLDDALIHLYVNGQEVDYQFQIVGEYGRPPLPDWRTEGEWNLMIGSEAWTPGRHTPTAIIDEVAIFNRVLTQVELEYLYNAGMGRPIPLSMTPIGFWRMDEAQGSLVQDSSGHGNHGLFEGTGAPLWTDGKILLY